MSPKTCRWLGYIVIGLAVFSALLIALWPRPETPWFLEVEIVNASGEPVTAVEIHHGNADTEEKITLFQLEPNTSRTLALNHAPGLGYNLTARFADGRELSICGGRAKGRWRMREVITAQAIYSSLGAED